jgi:hypothetical protein
LAALPSGRHWGLKYTKKAATTGAKLNSKIITNGVLERDFFCSMLVGLPDSNFEDDSVTTIPSFSHLQISK